MNCDFWNSIWNPYTFYCSKQVVPLLFLLIFLCVSLVMLMGGKTAAKKTFFTMMLLFSIFTIISATLLERRESTNSKAELELFWTLKKAWSLHSGYYWYNIFGNIGLFILLGLFLPAAVPKIRKSYEVILIGAVLSVCIEIIQYVWKLGLFEFDDMLHNTWGAALGYNLFRCAAAVGSQRWKPVKEWLLPFLILAVHVILFAGLLFINQPDWV